MNNVEFISLSNFFRLDGQGSGTELLKHQIFPAAVSLIQPTYQDILPDVQVNHDRNSGNIHRHCDSDVEVVDNKLKNQSYSEAHEALKGEIKEKEKNSSAGIGDKTAELKKHTSTDGDEKKEETNMVKASESPILIEQETPQADRIMDIEVTLG